MADISHTYGNATLAAPSGFGQSFGVGFGGVGGVVDAQLKPATGGAVLAQSGVGAATLADRSALSILQTT